MKALAHSGRRLDGTVAEAHENGPRRDGIDSTVLQADTANRRCFLSAHVVSIMMWHGAMTRSTLLFVEMDPSMENGVPKTGWYTARLCGEIRCMSKMVGFLLSLVFVGVVSVRSPRRELYASSVRAQAHSGR